MNAHTVTSSVAEINEGSAPTAPRVIALIPAVSGQKGGLGEPILYDLVVGEKTLWAVPLRPRPEVRATGKDFVKTWAGNWVAPGMGNMRLRQQIAERLQRSLTERWALYVQGQAESMAKSDRAGLIIALDEIQGIRMAGIGEKYVELRLSRATYYFKPIVGRTEEILAQMQAAIGKSRII